MCVCMCMCVTYMNTRAIVLYLQHLQSSCLDCYLNASGACVQTVHTEHTLKTMPPTLIDGIRMINRTAKAIFESHIP